MGDYAPVWFSLDLLNETDTRYFPGSNVLFLAVVYERAIEFSALSDNAVIAEILPVPAEFDVCWRDPSHQRR